MSNKNFMLSCVQHERLINSGPDQTASRFADSDLVLHYLPMSHKNDGKAEVCS